jgi:hypothetical protein
MRGAPGATFGRCGLDNGAPPSWKAAACLSARLRDKSSNVLIVQSRRIVECEVPHHCAGALKQPSRIQEISASEKEEIHPARVEDDRQCRVGGAFGWREPDDETGVPVADQFDSAGHLSSKSGKSASRDVRDGRRVRVHELVKALGR